jgi:hypothetical protein
MQFFECIGFEQKLKKCNGSKNFSVSKLRWSLQSGTLGIKSKLGRGGGMPLILKHNQGMLHGRPDKVQCGVQWPSMQIPHLPLYLRMTHLQNLLKYYGPVEHVMFFSELCIVNPNLF